MATIEGVKRLAFDHVYEYEELTSLLEAWAHAHSRICRLESIGPSWEGRHIWLVTLTNGDTGPALEKPGFLVEANIHSNEWTGSTAALNLIERVLHGYGSDEKITRLVDTRCLYVVPRLNPDGAERALHEGRYIRSSVRPYPTSGPRRGLQRKDIDKDGRVLFMRVRDPHGPWKKCSQEPRLLVSRDPDEIGGEYFRVYPEGEIEGYDGFTVKVAPPLEGLDIGVNLPGDWRAVGKRSISGPYPGSEPEIRAYLAAITSRPNITGHVAFHTFGGIILRPPSDAEDELPKLDKRVFEVFGAKATELTGYPTIPWLNLITDKRSKSRSGAFDWFYEHLGLYTWTTELWNPQREAGIPDGFHPSGWLSGDHPLEDALTLIGWSDRELDGKGFVDWYPFQHPQLGLIELGGWDMINYWYNPPFKLLQREVSPHADWIIFQALASPLLEVRSFDARPAESDVYSVRLVLQNAGWLPTYVSQKALEGYLVRPISVELELPHDAQLIVGDLQAEAGQLEGAVENRAMSTWWSYKPDTDDLIVLSWVIKGRRGSEISVTAKHDRAGTTRASTRL